MASATQVVRLSEYTKNAKWFFDHIDELRGDSRYGGAFVAISNGKVIAFHKDIEHLSSALENLPEKEIGEAAMVEFVGETPCAMLL